MYVNGRDTEAHHLSCQCFCFPVSMRCCSNPFFLLAILFPPVFFSVSVIVCFTLCAFFSLIFFDCFLLPSPRTRWKRFYRFSPSSSVCCVPSDHRTSDSMAPNAERLSIFDNSVRPNTQGIYPTLDTPSPKVPDSTHSWRVPHSSLALHHPVVALSVNSVCHYQHMSPLAMHRFFLAENCRWKIQLLFQNMRTYNPFRKRTHLKNKIQSLCPSQSSLIKLPKI